MFYRRINLTSDLFVDRYFRWHGSMAGLIIAALGALVLPGQVIVEKACHYYSERHILKVSTILFDMEKTNGKT